MRSRRLGPAIILAAIMAMLTMLQPTAASPQTATQTQAAAPVTVKVMSFNIWLGGNQVSFGQVVQAIRTAGADIVGVQEPGGNLARLATELGWYHHAGQNVVSRYPLVDPAGGGPYVYAAVAPGQAVAVSNVHLTAYPYAPYDLRDGSSVATVLANEQRIHMSEMASRFQSLPAVAARGVPVFLTGDFNVPSHLDWTDARKPEHFGYAVRWPVSAELERLGFRDTYRQVNPNPSTRNGHTWSPGYPPPNTDPDEVHDRIDFVYAIGPATTTASQVVGESSANADVVVSPWPSDHRAVVATFTATPAPLPHSVTTDRADYAPGGPIKVDFAGPGNARDWIGIYREGDTPGSTGARYWKYVGGSQTPGGTVANGSVTFDAGSPGTGAGSWPPPPGSYRVHLLENDGHRILASASFRVLTAGQLPTVATSRSSYRSGETVSVSFSNASGHASSWVGIYPADVTPGAQAAHRWAYLDARTSGSVTLGQPQSGSTWPLPPGSYRVHLFRDGGYVVDASASFSVVAR